MKLKLIDNRFSIVERCQKAGIDAVHGDYFTEVLKIPNHVLCTASNRSFTYGGGIDRQFLDHFPLYCQDKQKRAGTNERIGNICFVITVDAKLQSNKELVRKALEFAVENTMEHETLCIVAGGCGIGLLPEDVFVEVLKEVLKE